MVVLSTHLAALACLCAALPFAVPAKAAYLFRGDSFPKTLHQGHATSSMLGHGHNIPERTHQLRPHATTGFPPLLQRHLNHEPMKRENHREQVPHHDPLGKTPRSVFARSRYLRASVPLGRRSSVYVPGEHGDMYAVSRTPPRRRERRRKSPEDQTSYARVYRQVDESTLVLGKIDIMGDTLAAGRSQRLASLTVDSTPIDWTSGQSSTKAFQLNASTNNQTQFIMLPAHDSSNASGGLDRHVTVTLATEVFDPNTAEMIMYCATYDPDPGATSSLVMTACKNTQPVRVVDPDDPCADDENAASALDPHESQLFSYDPSTGQIEPMSATPSSSASGPRDNAEGPACGGARVRRDGGGSSTTTSSAGPSNTPTSAAAVPSGASQLARNVTLVYVATALQVPASSSNSTSKSTSTGTGVQMAVLTTTVTTTLVETVSAPGSSASGTVTPPRAAASPPTTTVSAPTPSLPTSSRPSVSSSSSTSAPEGSSSAPVNAEESLEVEIVGVTTTVTAGTSPTPATRAMTSSSSFTSQSLDPQAVASLVASSFGRRRRAMFASAVGR